jgi:transcriptional regulator with XRE-family HTH domain
MKQPELGAYITTLRNNKGLTQKELAEQCNVDIRTIQRIENGDVVPRMYTINLLAKALDADINLSADVGSEAVIDERYARQIRFAWICGIVFSINYLWVIYNIITGRFDGSTKLSLMLNIVGMFLFFGGFYRIGKKYNNPILWITTLTGMALVAIINIACIMQLFKLYEVFYPIMCANAIFTGIGLYMQGVKIVNNGRINFYKVAGITAVIQSALFLTLDLKIQFIGLVISAFCNLFMLAILYNEYRGNETPLEKSKAGLLLS